MIPGKAKILTCPECHKQKFVLSLLSGNTFGAEYWSDQKEIAPMLPRVSPLQLCEGCHHYYFLEDQDDEYSEEVVSVERGLLSLEQLLEAYEELKDSLSPNKEFILRVMLLQAFNDRYYRGMRKLNMTARDKAIFKSNVKELVKLDKYNSNEMKLFLAEMYREIGEYEVAAKVLSDLVDATGMTEKIRQEMINRVNAKDSEVFLLNPILELR